MIALAALAACTAAASAGRWWWVCELASHFRAQYAVLLLFCAAGLVMARQSEWAAAAGLLGAVNLIAVLPAYGRLVIPGRQTQRHPLRALLINVNFRNNDYARTLETIRRLDPDFVCIIEVNRAWKEQLLTLRDRYPAMLGTSFPNPWGMWLMSRRPFTRSEVVRHNKRGIAHITADLTVEGKPLTVILAHPYAPLTRRYAALRNLQLVSLRNLINSQQRPLLVIGDFNCSPWSPYFSQLLKMARLRDSRQGFGLQPTWPTWNAFLRIPIDHCLVSPGIAIQNRSIGPDIGSDHLPIVVDFSIT